ncbi:MAG: ACP S-malonyltransferase [Thermoanaerobaculia bacterium]
MPLALLFPGQGSQYVGMGKDLCDAFPEAKKVFDEADAALGFSISKICFEGPEEELRRTMNTQPAILTHSIAVLEVVRTRHSGALAGILAAAGHSLGEYSADVAAGAIAFSDAVQTVHERGKFMQEAVPEGVGAMAAVLGLAPDQVAAACDDAEIATGKIVSPANFNSPEQTVIAGHVEAVAAASDLCRSRGARKVLPLPVSAPFHCALMQPAADRLAPKLDALAVSDPAFPVVTNVDAEPATNAGEIRAALARQVASAVRWVESIEKIAAMGATSALELGPGAVLAGLLKRIRKDMSVTSIGKSDDLAKIG